MEKNFLQKKSINREIYFDIIRIIATFAVIILHVSAQNWSKVNINSFKWNIFNFWDSIVRWVVPVFIMISGALFLNRNDSVKKIYKKNILRIVTAFLFWSFLYAAIQFLFDNKIKNAIFNFFGGYYHMWFLFIIVGLYIIIPLIKKIIENDFLTKYFMILSLIFAFIIPQCISIISLIYPDIANFVQGVINKFNMYFVIGYTFYFILGYYLNKIEISNKATKIIAILGICGFISTIILTNIVTQYTKKPSEMFYGNFRINILLECLFVFVMCKKLFKDIKINDRLKNIIVTLSKYSFGIYLVHALIIMLLDKLFNINTLTINPLISVPVISLIVFFVSLLISAIINKIPKLNKYIV